ncbi:MAG: hypothetical protein ACI4RF_03135, partial [Eubacterium sp.]
GELDFYGYDPYTLGYQLIDIFYEGIYITSINVFVYGDDGYAPLYWADVYTVFGKEDTQLAAKYWLKCMGDGILSYEHRFDDLYEKYGLNEKLTASEYKAAFNNMTADPWYKIQSGQNYLYAQLDDENATGWQNATINLPDGAVYTYKTCHVYEITSFSVDNTPDLLKVNIKDLSAIDLSNLEFCAVSYDGSVDKISSDDIIYSFCILENETDESSNNTNLGGTITENSPINSAFGILRFSLNREKYLYSLNYFNIINAYCYKDGYEDFNLTIETNYSTEDTFVTGTAEDTIKDSYVYKLQSYENFDMIPSSYITIDGLDTSKAGIYDVAFTATLDGEAYSDSKTIYIVDKINTTGFQIADDANKNKKFLPGETLDISKSKFTYTLKNGTVIDIDPNNVTAKICTGGTDNVVNNPLTSDKIRVDYYYKGSFKAVYYSTWGVINSLSFKYSAAYNGISANWTNVEDAEYYVITMRRRISNNEYEEYSYTCETNKIIIDTNLVNGENQQISLRVCAVCTVDGEQKLGYPISSLKTISIQGYTAPEE